MCLYGCQKDIIEAGPSGPQVLNGPPMPRLGAVLLGTVLRGVISEGIRIRWSAHAWPDVAGDPELLRLMADSGCSRLYIGFEPIDSNGSCLCTMKHRRKDILDCITAVKDHGIEVHGRFVVGSDSDDAESIRKAAESAEDLGMDAAQFQILTPLPGTSLFYEMARHGRLLHTDWSEYDVQHAVFSPLQMTPSTLEIETLRAIGRFHSWKYIFRNLKRLDFRRAAGGLFSRAASQRSIKALSACLDGPDYAKG